MNSSLNYDYTIEHCQELTNKEIRECLREKAKMHEKCYDTLVEMIWTEEELCPPVYSNEDARIIEEQKEWHARMGRKLREMIEQGW